MQFDLGRSVRRGDPSPSPAPRTPAEKARDAQTYRRQHCRLAASPIVVCERRCRDMENRNCGKTGKWVNGRDLFPSTTRTGLAGDSE
jgi:hypothetical protein